MDIGTIATALGLSVAAAVGVARWLAKRLVDQQLEKDLIRHRSELDQKVGEAKAELNAELRRDVEEYLGERAAERQYAFEAKKRLYTAIGPLRFQLVKACVDYANRVDRIGRGRQPFGISLARYFGRSTAYRLLRIFAICELIERQMTYADFAVDRSTVRLLRFKHQAFLAMSSSTVAQNHPAVNWDEQVEHVFYDTLSMIACALIVADPAGSRIMRFDEFCRFLDVPDNLEAIHPVARLLEDFSINKKPILWLRLVALAQLCCVLIGDEGPAVGIESESFDAGFHVCNCEDSHISQNQDRYKRAVYEISMNYGG